MSFIAIAIAALTACATSNMVTEKIDDPDTPSPPEGADAGLDAQPQDATSSDCHDCIYFPPSCSPDALCPSDLFDENHPARLPFGTLINSIRGRAPNDVWLVGNLSALAHFDGTSWSRFGPFSQQTLNDIWLRDDGEIAIGDIKRVFAHRVDLQGGKPASPSDGDWKEYSPSTGSLHSFGSFVSAWAAPDSNWLWCAMSAYSSTGLLRLRRTQLAGLTLSEGIANSMCSALGCRRMRSIHGASRDVLWAVGSRGATFRITDAESDSPQIEGFNSLTWSALNGVWVASDDEAWSVGANGTVRHYTGQPVFWDIVEDVPTSVSLNAIWGSSASDVWVVGDNAVVLHYDGSRWSRVEIGGLGMRRPNLTAVWGDASGRVWIGGEGVLLVKGGKA